MPISMLFLIVSSYDSIFFNIKSICDFTANLKKSILFSISNSSISYGLNAFSLIINS